MNILITGGSGFIGKNLAEQLSPRFTIYAPRHSELDLLDEKSVAAYFKQNQIDYIIHSAGVGVSKAQQGRKDILETNVRMAELILNYGRACKKIIMLGSGAEYGKQRDLINVTEDEFGKVMPADEYGLAKYKIAELITNTANAINFRLFGVFGKYEDYNSRFISNVLCRAIFGMSAVIHRDALFDYLYVDDLTRIVESFLTLKNKFQNYNVGTGQPRSLLSIIKDIEQIIGQPISIVVEQEGMSKRYTLSNRRLMAGLPVEFKFTPFDSGLVSLYNWYRENKSSIHLNG